MTSPSDNPAIQATIRTSTQDHLTGEAMIQVQVATALQQQLAATVMNSSDYLMLRVRLTECYARLRAPYAIAWYSRGANGDMFPHAHRLQGPVLERDDVQSQLAESASNCARQQCDIVEAVPSVKNLMSIHLPVRVSETITDVVTVLLVNTDTDRINNEIMSAHHLVHAAEDWWKGKSKRQLSSQLQGTAALLELIGLIENGETHSESCTILANTLRNHLGADLVAVGVRKKNSLGCNVEALSSLGEFDPNSAKVRSIRAALDESAVRGQLAVWPPRQESEQYQLLATRKASADLRMDYVVTVPLKSDGETICGSLFVAGASSKLVESDVVNFVHAAGAPVGACLTTMQRADGGRVAQFGRKIFKSGNVSRWKVLAGTAVGVLVLMALPIHYRIPCQCTVEPVERRFSVAPYDGMIERTLVQPGETVKAGQLLAQMDGREVQWELAGVTAEASRAMKQRDTHMARLEVPKSIMASLDVDRLTNRTELLQYRAENMEVRSPIDGVIVAGTVDRRENFPVKVGQTLYEIAPLEQVRIEVAIPDEDAGHVEVGMTVHVRMDAVAGSVLSGTIERVRPRSEVRNDDNVFIAEVVLDNPGNKLRPGAEGNARVVTNRRCVAWILFHRAWEKTVTTFLW